MGGWVDEWMNRQTANGWMGGRLGGREKEGKEEGM